MGAGGEAGHEAGSVDWVAGQRGRGAAEDGGSSGFIPDLVTDQTSSHDPMWGYLPPAKRR